MARPGILLEQSLMQQILAFVATTSYSLMAQWHRFSHITVILGSSTRSSTSRSLQRHFHSPYLVNEAVDDAVERGALQVQGCAPLACGRAEQQDRELEVCVWGTVYPVQCVPGTHNSMEQPAIRHSTATFACRRGAHALLVQMPVSFATTPLPAHLPHRIPCPPTSYPSPPPPAPEHSMRHSTPCVFPAPFRAAHGHPSLLPIPFPLLPPCCPSKQPNT